MEIVLETFEKIVKCFKFQPEIDLCASRHNNQVKKYIAWTLDPMPLISWKNIGFYAFPPFSMIGRTA